MKPSNHYIKYVYWSDEDQCYIGCCPAFSGNSCHGDKEVMVYAEICKLVGEWIDICAKNNDPLPKPDIHRLEILRAPESPRDAH